MISKEGFQKNSEGYYDEEGYGIMTGNKISFYGASENWICAGWSSGVTKDTLKRHNLTAAKKKFQQFLKEHFGQTVSISDIDLMYGEAGQ